MDLLLQRGAGRVQGHRREGEEILTELRAPIAQFGGVVVEQMNKVAGSRQLQKELGIQAADDRVVWEIQGDEVVIYYREVEVA